MMCRCDRRKRAADPKQMDTERPEGLHVQSVKSLFELQKSGYRWLR